MRKRLSTDRPDWPKFMIRNIPPGLWARVKARALKESDDGNPRINRICLRLLDLYAAVGLPPGINPTSRPSVDPSVSQGISPSTDPSVSPSVSPSADRKPAWMTDHQWEQINRSVSPSTDPTVNPDTSDKE